MKNTPAKKLINTLGHTVMGISLTMGVEPEKIQEILNEEKFYTGDISRWKAGQGMLMANARVLALHLGIHRELLVNTGTYGTRIPINTKNKSSMINGSFGSLQLSLKSLSENLKPQDFVFPIFESTATEWQQPEYEAACSFITTGMDAVIVMPGALHAFHCEKGNEGKRNTAIYDQMNPKAGINPELLLGLSDLQDLVGDHSLLSGNIHDAVFREMTPQYVNRIYNFTRNNGGQDLLNRMRRVTLFMKKGSVENMHLPSGKSRLMKDFYTLIRNGKVPPYFLLGDDHGMSGISMDEIAMIRFPWSMISDRGAHLGLTATKAPASRGINPPHQDSPELIHLTRDMMTVS